MKLTITEAKREGGKLVLSTPEAGKFLYHFKPGEYEITKAIKQRSLNANAYMWALIGKIAATVGIPANEVYSRAIHEAGVYTPLPIKSEAVEEFTRIWKSHGTGWLIEVVDDSKIPGYKLVKAYNGSSSYNTAQMSRLIDYIVEDAKALDIETLTERELSLLKEGWK